MRLIYSGLILLLLTGCFALNKAHYEAIESLDSNYNALDTKDRQLAQQLADVYQEQQGGSHAKEQ